MENIAFTFFFIPVRNASINVTILGREIRYAYVYENLKYNQMDKRTKTEKISSRNFKWKSELKLKYFNPNQNKSNHVYSP
jgi:hypothetical protein